MATAEKPNFMWIPPPPLPEFYLPKEQVEKKKVSPSSSSSSGTEIGDEELVKVQKTEADAKERQPPLPGDGAYDGLPPAYRYVGIPQPSPAVNSNYVPPLAIYHICRICLRPRSGKYHREHPIPVNGVPPPPGICRRCRVTSVKESSESSELNNSDVDEVVRKGQSNEMKLGVIAPFVPDEAIISNEEAKRMEAQRYLRGRSRERHVTIFREISSESQRRNRRSKSRRSDIVYRHVRVVEGSEPRLEPRARLVKEPPVEVRPARRNSDVQRRFHYERTAKQTIVKHQEPKTRSSESRPPLQNPNIANVDSARASQSSQGTSSSSMSGATPTKHFAAKTVYLKRPDRTDSEIRKIAGEEARRYAAEVQKNLRPESDVRRIAHEEVSRYREAERKLEAYPGAFAHGRLVPMPPQIEVKRSEPPEMPWEQSQKAPTSAGFQRADNMRQPEKVSIKSTTPSSSKSPVQSDRESWGPQWRRELSLERRRSSETTEEKWRVNVAEETRSKVSVQPSDLPRRDKPRSTYDVVPDSSVTVRGSKVPSQAASRTQRQPSEPIRSIHPSEDAEMGLLFPPARLHQRRGSIDREREMIERLSVRSRPSTARRSEVNSKSAASPGKPVVVAGGDDTEVRRSTISRSSAQCETSGSGGTSSGTAESTPRPYERGQEQPAAYMAEKGQPQNGGAPSLLEKQKSTSAHKGSNVEYEYKLHTIRPADRPNDVQPRPSGSPRGSRSPSHVTLEIWQEVPTDPAQRAREASKYERERLDAVEWLKKRVDDPKAQVGIDPDGSVRLACSIPHRGSDKQRAPSSPKTQRSSTQPSPWMKDGSPWLGEESRFRRPSLGRSPVKEECSPRQSESRSKRLSGHRGGGGDAAKSPDKEMVVEVWEQVPVKEAAQVRRQAAEDARKGKEYVIEAWKQVPSDRPSASSVRRDSAMEMPPARRRRERREHQGPSEDSAHVKFASKIEISPTPPGSDESSNAFRRFHDFMGRKTARQQIDGHYSDEKGEDLVAEYERRGRSRSREPAQRKSEHAYIDRRARDRDATVRPRDGQRRYDGQRDDGWRPLQRALSESPSREWDDRKRSSVKGGPPYHPDEKPSGSMTTHDGSRSGSRWW